MIHTVHPTYKMVCDGPDPPDNSPQELTPPPRHDLMMNGNQAEESDEENEYFGYEPLPQGPETIHSDNENSDDETQGTQNMDQHQAPTNDVPAIEPMDNVLSREVWSAPRPVDPIEMDNERAQQVMSAMANFALPQASIPDWAQSVTEDQWKQTLHDRIERLRSNR